MKFDRSICILVVLLFSLVILSSLINVSAQANLIVNSVNALIESRGERFSDSQLWAYSPDGSLSDYKIITLDSSGLASHNVSLGTQGDFRDGCFELIGTRRTGICEDGTYTLEMIDTDAAGNIANTKESLIERDTVSPIAPVVNNAYVCSLGICIDIPGEVGTSIVSN